MKLKLISVVCLVYWIQIPACGFATRDSTTKTPAIRTTNETTFHPILFEQTLKSMVHQFQPDSQTVTGSPIQTTKTANYSSVASNVTHNQTIPQHVEFTLPWVLHTQQIFKTTNDPRTVPLQTEGRTLPLETVKSTTAANTAKATELVPQTQTEERMVTNSEQFVLVGLVESIKAPEILFTESTMIEYIVPVLIEESKLPNLEAYVQKSKFVQASGIYGNKKYSNSVFMYIFPSVLGSCVLTTGIFICLLSKRLKKASSQMNKASCLLLIAVAIADILTMCFALAEITYLFCEIKDNNGLLPFDKCQKMLVLERLSAIPHAASTWLTVILAVQRYLCVSKPFSAGKHIRIGTSFIYILSVSVLSLSLHVCRFFDKDFFNVNVQTNNITIGSCQAKHAEWVGDPVLYESVFAWTRIVLTQFLPCILIITFVALMINSLRKTTQASRHIKLTDSKLNSDRRHLSVLVALVACIVFCVEMSSGIFLSLNAWEMSTGQVIVQYQSLKSATTAFDLVLYVSYFAIFLLYCLMSKELRRTFSRIGCFRTCQAIHLDCGKNKDSMIFKKSTIVTLLPMEKLGAPDDASCVEGQKLLHEA